MPIPRPFGQSLRSSLRRPSFIPRRQQPMVAITATGRGESTCRAVRWTSQQSRAQPHQQDPTTAQSAPAEDGVDRSGGKVEGLPAPGEGVKLDVSGEGSSVSLGHLGPLVVNRDGTTGRVANWETMTVHEKETTMALLKKRNKARLDALKKDQENKS